MKLFYKISTIFVVCMGFFIITNTAQATCTKFGYFIRVVTFEGHTYAMFREEPADHNYFQIEAVDSQVAAAVYQAYKGGSKAYIRTTQAACATMVDAGTNKIDLGVVDRIGLGY